MIAWDSRINPPPPSPCTARPAMSVVMSWDRPPITEPTMKMLMAPMKRPLRPIRSPSFPYTGIMTVEARMYAVVTQTMWLTPFNSPTMVGKAVLKIIWSSEARSIVIISPTKTRMIDRLSGEASVSVCVPSGSTVAASRVDM